LATLSPFTIAHSPKNSFMKQELFGIKKRLLLLCLLFVVLFLKAGNKNGNISLVKNGKSDYVIILAAGANAMEQRAATLLQDYIFKISGCKLPTASVLAKGAKAIFINISTAIKHPDGFSIKTKGKNIYIAGGNNKGCVYGAIELLEKWLGCHYYSPFYKIIPTSTNISLPSINFSDQPKDDCRIINISDKADEDFIDWNRLNTVNEFFAEGYYVHTFNRLVPWQEYFQIHPEYFAMMNGKRNIDQLCLTNPEVLKK